MTRQILFRDEAGAAVVCSIPSDYEGPFDRCGVPDGTVWRDMAAGEATPPMSLYGAWRLSDDGSLWVDMPTALEIWRSRLAAERHRRLDELEAEWRRARRVGDTVTATAAAAAEALLLALDIAVLPLLATTPEALAAIWPAELGARPEGV
ncbi:hypothetical protein NON00_13045 [Roseomonas sp. GC11]|uniref:hypothetical protein n=1 Tax=Roseomonas sp. GC11 TaxID=2950546 RepID=UPI00210BE09B|nr:hypothetical protein [Roseomonas sp. GC11]MCQ4160854.1 hypothetical protein [Roseomonas sp. GC11]